jgi:hypothetical protein
MAEASRDPAVLDAWIGVQLRLGATANASAALPALSNAGYRDPDFIAMLAKYGFPTPPPGAAATRIAQLATQMPDPKSVSPN